MDGGWISLGRPGLQAHRQPRPSSARLRRRQGNPYRVSDRPETGLDSTESSAMANRDPRRPPPFRLNRRDRLNRYPSLSRALASPSSVSTSSLIERRVGRIEAARPRVPGPSHPRAQSGELTTRWWIRRNGMPEALAMKKRVATPLSHIARPRRRSGRVVLFALFALGSQVGCSREFFREWANSDVSEAVFEKSRDPRWRMDIFSIEPPSLARFANPYDPDRQPAPPDDFSTQSLSPVPQNPDHRLIMPAEGTGYLTILDEGPRYESPPPQPPPALAPVTNPGLTPPPQLPAPPEGSAPFSPGSAMPPTPNPTPGPGANSGPKSPGMSPTSLASSASRTKGTTTNRNGERTSPPPQAAKAPGVGQDQSVRRTAMQDPTQPMTIPRQVPNHWTIDTAAVHRDVAHGPDADPQDLARSVPGR